MLSSLAVLLLFICSHVWGHEHPILNVNTTSGIVRGAIDPSYPLVRRFLGLPYAEPPVHHLRWEPPVPKSVVSAGINATHFGASCPQFCPSLGDGVFYCDIIPQFRNQGPTSEDCLLLSIWAPIDLRRTRRNATGISTGFPVLLWLHGGAWIFGGSSTPYLQPSQVRQTLGFCGSKCDEEHYSDRLVQVGSKVSKPHCGPGEVSSLPFFEFQCV